MMYLLFVLIVLLIMCRKLITTVLILFSIIIVSTGMSVAREGFINYGLSRSSTIITIDSVLLPIAVGCTIFSVLLFSYYERVGVSNYIAFPKIEHFKLTKTAAFIIFSNMALILVILNLFGRRGIFGVAIEISFITLTFLIIKYRLSIFFFGLIVIFVTALSLVGLRMGVVMIAAAATLNYLNGAIIGKLKTIIMMFCAIVTIAILGMLRLVDLKDWLSALQTLAENIDSVAVLLLRSNFFGAMSTAHVYLSFIETSDFVEVLSVLARMLVPLPSSLLPNEFSLKSITELSVPGGGETLTYFALFNGLGGFYVATIWILADKIAKVLNYREEFKVIAICLLPKYFIYAPNNLIVYVIPILFIATIMMKRRT